MTQTEELRKKLDKLEVKHKDLNVPKCCHTEWGCNLGWAFFYEDLINGYTQLNLSFNNEKIFLTLESATIDQVIMVTLNGQLCERSSD